MTMIDLNVFTKPSPSPTYFQLVPGATSQVNKTLLVTQTLFEDNLPSKSAITQLRRQYGLHLHEIDSPAYICPVTMTNLKSIFRSWGRVGRISVQRSRNTIIICLCFALANIGEKYPAPCTFTQTIKSRTSSTLAHFFDGTMAHLERKNSKAAFYSCNGLERCDRKSNIDN